MHVFKFLKKPKPGRLLKQRLLLMMPRVLAWAWLPAMLARMPMRLAVMLGSHHCQAELSMVLRAVDPLGKALPLRQHKLYWRYLWRLRAA